MIRILTPNDTLAVVLAVLSSEIKKRPESTVEELCQAMPRKLLERHPDDCRRLAHNLVDQMASSPVIHSEGRQDDDQ